MYVDDIILIEDDITKIEIGIHKRIWTQRLGWTKVFFGNGICKDQERDICLSKEVHFGFVRRNKADGL